MCNFNELKLSRERFKKLKRQQLDNNKIIHVLRKIIRQEQKIKYVLTFSPR